MTKLSNERLDELQYNSPEPYQECCGKGKQTGENEMECCGNPDVAVTVFLDDYLALIAQARRANDLLSRQPVTLESGEVVQLVPVEPSFQMLPAATQADEYDAPLTAAAQGAKK